MSMRHGGGDGDSMPPVKFAWFDVAVLDQLDDMMRAHANYLRDRREAFDDMMKDIERL